MAKVKAPFYSMEVSGALGEIVFDRRGFIRRKGRYTNPKTAKQGNARQAMAAAQRCIKLCGPQTRQQVRAVADRASTWGPFLTRQFLGPKRVHYLDRTALYHSEGVDQPAWEQAAVEVGLREVNIDYANDGPVSAGAQLFMLAATLYDLGIYEALGAPAGDGTSKPDVEGWKDSIAA
jgi:hypothetical protein